MRFHPTKDALATMLALSVALWWVGSFVLTIAFPRPGSYAPNWLALVILDLVAGAMGFAIYAILRARSADLQ